MHVRLSCASLLIFVACLTFAQQTPQTVSKSDRDKAGLRGPVQTVLEAETSSYANGPQAVTRTMTYAPDGRILEERLRNTDGSEVMRSYSYYPDGRLLGIVSSYTATAERSVTIYLYDDARRLSEVKSTYGNESRDQRFQYDDKGRKLVVETLNPPKTAFTNWDGTELGFSHIPVGTVATSYNEQGIATGAEYHDAAGKLVGHIERQFDAEGHVTSEEQVENAPEFPFFKDTRPKKVKMAYSYTYDAHGRVKVRRWRLRSVEELTITKYNDHGDKASEHRTMVSNSQGPPPEVGIMSDDTIVGTMILLGTAHPSKRSLEIYEVRYTYQYDQYGNWTEQTIALRSQPDDACRPATVIHRKLTYY